MKRNRDPTNKPVMKRYATLDSSFGSRSFSVRSPFVLRSSSVHPPFELRSGSVRAPFKLRSSSVRESKIDRRLIDE